MPVIESRIIDDSTLLGVWEITESSDELLSSLTLTKHEQQFFNGFRTDLRKKQWLAYRLLIQKLFPDRNFTVAYDKNGKPYLENSNHHISVTHTGQYAACIISTTKRVGIDIEMVKPRIDKVRHKFLSPSELSHIPEGQKLEILTIYWCAKEALYKLHGKKQLDFIKNIKVPDFTFDNTGEFEAEITTTGSYGTYRICYELFKETALVYVLDKREDSTK